MNSIPVSQQIDVLPSVLAPGGSPLGMNSVFLTQDSSIPINSLQPFANLAAVGDWFGNTSPQYGFAGKYFGGFNGATQVPNVLYWAQYNVNAVGAYLRGGSVASLTLANLQALTGNIIIAIDGRTVTSANINLASATSPSNAAALIQTGLQTPGGIFNGTASLAGTVMDVTAVTSGLLHIGDTVVGTGIPANTTIVSFGTGMGGVGTYNMSAAMTTEGAETVTVSSIATVTYDAQHQAFVIATANVGPAKTIAYPTDTSLSPPLFLTQNKGAVLSQGAAAATPAGTMDSLTNISQDFATFFTDWLPPLDTMLGFAAWVNSQNDNYCYSAYDNDLSAQQADATGSFGVLTKDYDGVNAQWDPSGLVAAFFCGAVASINFNAPNGRISFAYKGQPGLVPEVMDGTIAENLISNGYNFYGNYATRATQFQWYQNGQISGQWQWLDPYINQIYWNAALQLALANLLTNVKSIPYNAQGYNLIRTAISSVIQQMISFGAIVSGVVLSGSQVAALTAAVGVDISRTLFAYGYYLQVVDPGPNVRAVRGSPICNLYYTDGGSIQKITLGSVDVE